MGEWVGVTIPHVSDIPCATLGKQLLSFPALAHQLVEEHFNIHSVLRLLSQWVDDRLFGS